MMDEVAVLVPCYNESKTIQKVVMDFKKALPGAKIYVYDNNSTDGTVILAEKAGAVVRHEYNQGKGNVVRRMFREVDARVYILVDGDDTYSADDAVEMVKIIKEGRAEMVVGDRLSGAYYTENKRRFHNFGNNLVRFFVNKIFRTEIKDIMTGYRAMSFEFVKTFPVTSSGFEIETEMSIHAAFRRMRTENMTVSYRDRPSGSESKLNTIPDGIKVLTTIAYLLVIYRPLMFFGVLAAIFAGISVVLLAPVMVTYLSTGMVPRFPSLIVGCFGILIAILTLMVGLILKYMLSHDTREFEHKLVAVALLKGKYEK